jgi:hypothetical protein
MHPLANHDSRSVHDAVARLDYVRGVRERVRRTALCPSLASVVLGAVLVAHGVLRTMWPHTAVVSIIFLGSVLAARPLVRWLITRSEQRRGLQGSIRLRLLCGVAGIVAVPIAILLGANALISATAAAAAAAAYLAGLPALSAGAIAAGLIGDMMVAHGFPLAVGELVIGAGLLSLGAIGHAKERHRP